MGFTGPIPGVSGGIITFLFGIYDELLHSIKLMTGRIPLKHYPKAVIFLVGVMAGSLRRIDRGKMLVFMTYRPVSGLP